MSLATEFDSALTEIISTVGASTLTVGATSYSVARSKRSESRDMHGAGYIDSWDVEIVLQGSALGVATCPAPRDRVTLDGQSMFVFETIETKPAISGKPVFYRIRLKDVT